jgi:CBS domain-containing protein
MGPPPVSYCWLFLGSEGRREQTFQTDQDNAIIYADPKDEAQAKQAKSYFTRFARQAIDHLVKCGYPLCPGEIMAVNPRWCQPYSVWKGYFQRWMATPKPQEILNSTIFFDFRAGFGDHGLADKLRTFLQQSSQKQAIFLFHLAHECLAGKAPLSFFGNFMVQSDGEHKDSLNIKKQGLVQFVNFARIMALKNGFKESNTLARLQVLYDEGHLSRELWSAASEAYEFQMQLRLIHQLNQIENGVEPDNYINPSRLTELEKRMLKDAFSVIERLQAVLKTFFPN